MVKEFPLPVAGVVGSAERPVKIFKTVRAAASDGLELANPFWHRYFGSLAPELEAILEGTFCVWQRMVYLCCLFSSETTQAGRMTSTPERYSFLYCPND